MEQEDADVMIGPLSGDEGIAVANYAKEHPDKTFVNGIAGAQDSTLKVQAPNFFRFHPDGAQWSAGLGDYAYNDLGWKTAAIVGDDYSFPYTSLAGFVAEFCAIGGQVTKRIWAPLGEEDYSSYISQIPDDVDGLYVGIGGSGLISFIKQYQEQKGRVDTERMLGNVFWDDPLVLKEVGKSLVGGATAAMTAADANDARGHEVHGGPQDGVRRRDRRASARRCSRTATTPGMVALIKGLEAVDGDVSDQAALQEALAGMSLSGDEAPWGDVTLDDNRQAISDVYVKKIVKDANGDGVPDVQTFRKVPKVDQTFNGVFTADTPAARSHEPEVREGRGPAVGRQRRRGRLLVGVRSTWQQPQHPSSAPSRSSAYGGSAGASAASTPSATWTSRYGPGERRAILGPNGAGKTTLFNLISGEFPPTSGDSRAVRHRRDRHAGAQARADGALAHVPDLAAVPRPVGRGQPLPRPCSACTTGICGWCRRRTTASCARRRVTMGEAVGLADRLDSLVMDLSHGEQRQLEVGMARASDPKLMMLDEPAAGLSRAERVHLTELLLTLDPSITLILIEHDMDVALRVAQWVTMMHDGRVIVEGTPDDIRGNQTVHDLYLGSGLIHHD